ncbi:hypothetical protein RND81_06G153300 [Saponaria officinalis]|uniref:Uncharacterized protein n=1 Tax=Saponaria officinalis TaxID=3572 RepID=A0AAW1KBC5_SAPOF
MSFLLVMLTFQELKKKGRSDSSRIACNGRGRLPPSKSTTRQGHISSETSACNMEDVVLKMHYKVHFVEVLIEDTDRTLIIDVYNDMLDAVEEENIVGWPENPSLAYTFKSKSVRLSDDNDLMEMFRRLEGKKEIDLWIGSDAKPCHALLMAREARSYAEKDDVDAVEVTLESKKQGKEVTLESKKQGKPRAKQS